MSVNPAELLAMIAGLTEGIRTISVAMNEAVAVMVADGWTEEQAREVVAAGVASGLRGPKNGDDAGEQI